MKLTNKIIMGLCVLILMVVLVSAGNSEAGPAKTPGEAPAPALIPDQTLAVVQASIEVVFLEGEVLINGQEPDLGDRLGTKFVIQTGKGARCDIVFNSGNSLSVGQNALADFDFSSLVASVRIDRGGLSSVLKKLEQIAGTDAFTVQTATAIAGVRGTSFCVWVNETASYICACNGIVHVQDSAGGSDEILEATHHTARLFSKTGDSINKTSDGMRFHTDELLQSVASRIGHVIDWNALN